MSKSSISTVLIGSVAGLFSSATSFAATIFAIDDNPGQHLMSFDSSSPSALSTFVALSGLQPNEKLIGIDFRVNSATPANASALYGVGSFGRIYTINTATGQANFVAGLTDGASPIVLNGTEFGFDFNPQADRLRIVSDLDQNLRVNVDTGLTAVDTSINPSSSNVVDLAYDRSDTNASTPTTLYGIDSVTDQLVRIGGVDGTPSPNGGAVTPIGPLATVNAVSIGGFDISDTGAAFASLRPSLSLLGSSLYTINLSTGTATAVGPIGIAEDALVIKGLAVAPIPEPAMLSLATITIAIGARRRR